jgi:signal transduction histidine kinase
MADADLVDRLATLGNLAAIPRAELEWLVQHGEAEKHEAGSVLAPKGAPIEKLWVVLSGGIAVRVDRGAGPRRVTGWGPGEVSGMLPFSRMTGPPGDNYLEEETELLTVHKRHFPEMLYRCQAFTALTVHLMIDRARSFNASDMHDEKMISLGKLAAGLAHQLNNPASATLRGAKQLRASLADAIASSRTIVTAGLTNEQFDTIDQVWNDHLAEPLPTDRSAIHQIERENEIADWLDRYHADPDEATALAEANVTIEMLDRLVTGVPVDSLQAVLPWIAAGCSISVLTTELEQAATEIYELVSAIKQFTYMDTPAGPSYVDIEAGLRDTIAVLAAKAQAKNASITLAMEENLPRVCANGGELNQIWFNLIENALDAISENGRIQVSARAGARRVVIIVADDGTGISSEDLPRIFDPFFTTKPVGKGTGLGLGIAHQLVRRQNGDITVQSTPGWTEFRVSLLSEPRQT